MNITNQQRVEAWHLEWLACDEAHWGDNIDWKSADEVARRLDIEIYEEEGPPVSCKLAPEGMYCREEEGHDGDCQLFPEDLDEDLDEDFDA